MIKLITGKSHQIRASLKKIGYPIAGDRKYGDKTLNLELKEKGVLVRHFTAPRICEYNRITIGSREEMQILVDKIKEILEENV